MPTGYTEIIEENKNTTFKDYLRRCSRAFGAYLHMRDNGLDSPSQPAEVSPHYLEKIQEINKKIAYYKSMGGKEAQKLARKDFENKKKENKIYLLEKKEKLARYDLILEQVRNWNPPTKEHQELKEFAIRQIDLSTEFDRDERYDHLYQNLEEKSGEEWRKENIDRLEKELNFYKKTLKEETSRCDKANSWIAELEKSLKE